MIETTTPYVYSIRRYKYINDIALIQTKGNENKVLDDECSTSYWCISTDLAKYVEPYLFESTNLHEAYQKYKMLKI